MRRSKIALCSAIAAVLMVGIALPAAAHTETSCTKYRSVTTCTHDDPSQASLCYDDEDWPGCSCSTTRQRYQDMCPVGTHSHNVSTSVRCWDGSRAYGTGRTLRLAREAAEANCPTSYTETVFCGDGSQQTATAGTRADAQAAARRKCPTYTETVTCWNDTERTATGVTVAHARSLANAKCPPRFPVTVTCWDKTTRTATSSTEEGARRVALLKCPPSFKPGLFVLGLKSWLN